MTKRKKHKREVHRRAGMTGLSYQAQQQSGERVSPGSSRDPSTRPEVPQFRQANPPVRCEKCRKVAPIGWSRDVSVSWWGPGLFTSRRSLCVACAESFDSDVDRFAFVEGVVVAHVSRLRATQDEFEDQRHRLVANVTPCRHCGSTDLKSEIAVKFDIVAERRENQSLTVTCKNCHARLLYLPQACGPDARPLEVHSGGDVRRE